MLQAKSFVEKNLAQIGRLFFPRIITQLLMYKGIRPPQTYISMTFPSTILDWYSWGRNVCHMTTTFASSKRKGKTRIQQYDEGSLSEIPSTSQTNQMSEILLHL